MASIRQMPLVGIVVIIVIAALFVISLIMLFSTSGKYRRLSASVASGSPDPNSAFLRYTVNEFAAAYKKYGAEVNTPGIISNAFSVKLSGELFCERFLSSAVSLFVTLGLFGTFLGLSLSVSSLTKLIGYSNTSEWLSVLDSVGQGLMSSLSGMGVAFYTSLVGVACSILLTIFRAIHNPQSLREKLSTQIELWLDHTVAPTLPTQAAKDDATLVHEMIGALDRSSDSMEKTMQSSVEALSSEMDNFRKTVSDFNSGVHDFSEFNYNLRGTVERMDLCIRDLTGAMRQPARHAERKENQ